MVQLLLTSAELQQLSILLEAKPRYVGLYYYKQRPLEMFELGDLTVAVLNYEEEDESTVSVINYAELSVPVWKQNLPNPVEYLSRRRKALAEGTRRTQLSNDINEIAV